jgi:hypothetical protein
MERNRLPKKAERKIFHRIWDLNTKIYHLMLLMKKYSTTKWPWILKEKIQENGFLEVPAAEQIQLELMFKLIILIKGWWLHPHLTLQALTGMESISMRTTRIMRSLRKVTDSYLMKGSTTMTIWPSISLKSRDSFNSIPSSNLFMASMMDTTMMTNKWITISSGRVVVQASQIQP